MDKYEYKVRSDEIKSLIAQGDYVQAAEIADGIDWRRVKSVMMLCMVSDLYKINRRYEDAKNMLLLAYERRPGGRTVLYSLCELSIKTGEYVQALNYYKEFAQAAPKDSGRYILQYKLYEAQEVSLEERIGVLEELKKRDYREKWAYELAYLYHRVGLGTRCVEECDELILWFGEGKYVVKAMELKMLHQPLSPAQQEAYDRRFEERIPVEQAEPEAEGQEIFEEQNDYGQDDYGQTAMENQEDFWPPEEGADDEPIESAQAREESFPAPGKPDEMDIQVKTVDVGKYNTINLQAELAAGLQEVLGEDGSVHPGPQALEMPADDLTQEPPQDEDFPPEEEIEDSEVFFGATGEIADMDQADGFSGPGADDAEEMPSAQEAVAAKIPDLGVAKPTVLPEGARLPGATEHAMAVEPVEEAAEQPAVQPVEIVDQEQPMPVVQPPKELADVLSQEADGQISLVLPESAAVEKQITGQMKIEDVLIEWERIKKANEEMRKEEVRKYVMHQTGPMFTDFEAKVRDGLLEQLESWGAARSEAAQDDMPGDLEDVDVEETLSESQESDGTQEPEETGDAAQSDGADGEAEDGLEYIEDVEAQEDEYAQEEDEYIEDEEFVQDGYEDELEYEAEADLQEADPEEDMEYEGDADKEENIISVDDVDIDEEEATAEADIYPEDDIPDEEIVEEVEETRGRKEETEENFVRGKDAPDMEREKEKVRSLTREEKELFAPFIQNRRAKEQLVKALDGISMAAYTGNLIITGEEGMDTLTLAKNMMREVRMTDSNFSGKVAKVSGEGLNQKDVAQTLEQLGNGALIIQNASGMNIDTAAMLHKQLQQERFGIIVVLEDTKKAIKKLFLGTPDLYGDFTARIDLEALSNDTLVSFGKQYAREKEYSIDNLGVLALHTRIEELQTIDHAVTVIEVKQIVDEAIRRASRKTLGHFFDVLLAKRYDDEDMVILTEKDFVA